MYTVHCIIVHSSSNLQYTGCANKHGNSVTNSISSFQIILWFSVVILRKLSSVRVSSAMFTFCLFMFWLHTVVLVVLWKTRKLHLADIIILWLLKLCITMLIHNKDDIEFVTEFPCFLGHPVFNVNLSFCKNR